MGSEIRRWRRPEMEEGDEERHQENRAGDGGIALQPGVKRMHVRLQVNGPRRFPLKMMDAQDEPLSPQKYARPQPWPAAQLKPRRWCGHMWRRPGHPSCDAGTHDVGLNLQGGEPAVASSALVEVNGGGSVIADDFPREEKVLDHGLAKVMTS